MGCSDGCGKCRSPAKEVEIPRGAWGDGVTLCRQRSYLGIIENPPIRRVDGAAKPIGMKCYMADTGWRRTAKRADTFVYSTTPTEVQVQPVKPKWGFPIRPLPPWRFGPETVLAAEYKQ